MIWPTDDSEATKTANKISFATKINQISQETNHLAPIAEIFSLKKYLLSFVNHEIVDMIDTSKITNPWVNAVGMVSLKKEPTKISPRMFIKTTSKDDSEIVLHELIHYYINPYLEAAINQKNWDIKINAAQENAAITLYDSLHALYTEAKSKNYNVINWTSVVESMEEFVATITHNSSVEKLKELWLYDRLFHIIKTHIDTITSDTVTFSQVKKAS